MTEVEWLVCESPQEMYRFLRERMTPRRCRLFAHACGRRHCHIWHREKYSNPEEAAYWLGQKEEIDLLCRKVIDAADEDCNGVNRSEEIESLRNEVFRHGPLGLSWDLTATIKGDAEYWVMQRFQALPSTPSEQASLDATLLWEAYTEGLFLVNLLRDIFGNPFRPISIDPSHRTPTIVSLAQTAYDDRQLPSGVLYPQMLAVLADALEEVGAAELMEHLLSPAPHVRGCHVVDLCLGLG